MAVCFPTTNLSHPDTVPAATHVMRPVARSRSSRCTRRPSHSLPESCHSSSASAAAAAASASAAAAALPPPPSFDFPPPLELELALELEVGADGLAEGPFDFRLPPGRSTTDPSSVRVTEARSSLKPLRLLRPVASR